MRAARRGGDPGEKCAPWANDGGPSFNATHCVPVVDDPVAVGELCSVQDNAASGLDDCEAGAACWYVDEDLYGECLAHCGKSARMPECDPGYFCFQGGSALPSLCTPTCDPLASDCGDAVCVPIRDYFACVPDASAAGATHGSPCEFTNACPAGMFCIGADAHTDCVGSTGCCSTVCDVTAAEDPCPALDPGQSCEGWFVEGMAPEDYENTGVCALPV